MFVNGIIPLYIGDADGRDGGIQVINLYTHRRGRWYNYGPLGMPNNNIVVLGYFFLLGEVLM